MLLVFELIGYLIKEALLKALKPLIFID